MNTRKSEVYDLDFQPIGSMTSEVYAPPDPQIGKHQQKRTKSTLRVLQQSRGVFLEQINTFLAQIKAFASHCL